MRMLWCLLACATLVTNPAWAQLFNSPPLLFEDRDIRLIATADVNGDGTTDIIASTGSIVEASLITTRISIHLGEGQGLFANEQIFEVQARPQVTESGTYSITQIDVVDVNVDALRDIIVGHAGWGGGACGCYFGSVTVMLNQGNAAFDSATSYNTSPIQSLALADFDGDGAMDAPLEISTCFRRISGPIREILAQRKPMQIVTREVLSENRVQNRDKNGADRAQNRGRLGKSRRGLHRRPKPARRRAESRLTAIRIALNRRAKFVVVDMRDVC